MKPFTTCRKCQQADIYLRRHCPQCGACPEYQETRNYSQIWHEGDIHCTLCEAFVRSFDAD